MSPIRPIVAGLCLAVCTGSGVRAADTPPPATAPTVAMAPGCAFIMHSGRLRQGDNIPVGVHLRNTGQWCFTGLTFTGSSLNGTHVVDQPSHGELRMIVKPDMIVIAYRPKPGFTGGDTFLIGLPGDNGMDTHYSATVTVDP